MRRLEIRHRETVDAIGLASPFGLDRVMARGVAALITGGRREADACGEGRTEVAASALDRVRDEAHGAGKAD